MLNHTHLQTFVWYEQNVAHLLFGPIRCNAWREFLFERIDKHLPNAQHTHSHTKTFKQLKCRIECVNLFLASQTFWLYFWHLHSHFTLCFRSTEREKKKSSKLLGKKISVLVRFGNFNRGKRGKTTDFRFNRFFLFSGFALCVFRLVHSFAISNFRSCYFDASLLMK